MPDSLGGWHIYSLGNLAWGCQIPCDTSIYQWVSGRHCQVMSMLPNGIYILQAVECRSKQQAPCRGLPDSIVKTRVLSCHLHGQPAHKRQTLSEAAAHSRPPCMCPPDVTHVISCPRPSASDKEVGGAWV